MILNGPNQLRYEPNISLIVVLFNLEFICHRIGKKHIYWTLSTALLRRNEMGWRKLHRTVVRQLELVTAMSSDVFLLENFFLSLGYFFQDSLLHDKVSFIWQKQHLINIFSNIQYVPFGWLALRSFFCLVRNVLSYYKCVNGEFLTVPRSLIHFLQYNIFITSSDISASRAWTSIRERERK